VKIRTPRTRAPGNVKGNRQLWRRDPNDFYIEPFWCGERLFAVEKFDGPIWDPAAGIGRIINAALKAGHATSATDLIARPKTIWPIKKLDFLKTRKIARGENIVCNPPFKIADAFVKHALKLGAAKIAMLMPAGWIHGDERSRWLEKTPLRCIYFLAPRPSMPPGRVILAGIAPGNGTTNFAWFVWERGYRGPWNAAVLRREAAACR
jgi:hypothetical protein